MATIKRGVGLADESWEPRRYLLYRNELRPQSMAMVMREMKSYAWTTPDPPEPGRGRADQTSPFRPLTT